MVFLYKAIIFLIVTRNDDNDNSNSFVRLRASEGDVGAELPLEALVEELEWVML